MTPSLSEQLMDEALRLGDVLNSSAEEAASRTLDAAGLLDGQLAAATTERLQGIYRDTREKYQLVRERASGLVRRATELLAIGKQLSDFCEVRVSHILELNSRVDPAKIADEDLLLLLIEARDRVVAAPDAARLQIASFELAVFSQASSYVDVVSSFLDLKPMFSGMLATAAQLGKALALDVAGSQIPFLGMILTVCELMEPHIKRVTEKMTSATAQFDRLFQFEKGMTELLSYGDFVAGSMDLAAQAMLDLRESFTRDEDWLDAVLDAVAR